MRRILMVVLLLLLAAALAYWAYVAQEETASAFALAADPGRIRP